MTTIMVTASGARRALSPTLDRGRVAGLDEWGRLVVDDFHARTAEPVQIGDFAMAPFMFGLTLCCNASDKGCQDGVYCRACYGSKPNADTGNYLYRADDGSFPGLDPLDHFEEE